MRMALMFVVLSVLTGCVSWRTAVIGQSPEYPLAMWQGRDVRAVSELRDGQRVPLTWSRALGPGLDPTWALVDYHDVTEPSDGVSVVVVEGLHRVDGTARFPTLAPLIDRVLARHAIWVASHQSESDPILATFEGATRGTPDPQIVAIAWSTDRLELTVSTQLTALQMRQPCGGAPHPEVETVVGGVEWTRTYEVVADGTVTPTSDDTGGRVLPGPTACDPRLP